MLGDRREAPARSALERRRRAPSTANRTRMKNRSLGQVVVLLALEDVAVVLDQAAR